MAPSPPPPIRYCEVFFGKQLRYYLGGGPFSLTVVGHKKTENLGTSASPREPGQVEGSVTKRNNISLRKI